MAGRITQEVAEAVVYATSESARITQEVAEAVVYATSESARITQVVLEVIVLPANPPFLGEPGGSYW